MAEYLAGFKESFWEGFREAWTWRSILKNLAWMASILLAAWALSVDVTWQLVVLIFISDFTDSLLYRR